jgi:hypothetical protein
MFLRPKLPPDPLDMALLHWSKDDPFTVRDLLNSVAVFGRTGSGKTYASGKRLMRAAVRLAQERNRPRSGGLCLAAKPEDADSIREVFRQEGRADDLLVVNADGELRCNFLDYARQMSGDTTEIVRCITTIGECLRANNSRGGEHADFFEQEQARSIHNAVECVALGEGRVSAVDLQKFLISAAQSPQQLTDPKWREGFHSQCLYRAYRAKKSAIQEHDFRLAWDYWCVEFPNMADRMRSSITTGVFGILHVFNTGLARSMVSQDTNVSPDDILNGRWVLVNLPPSMYGNVGRLVNSGWKFLTQLAILRRRATPLLDPICVIFIDEAQQFVTQFDSHFLATCRSHLGCQIFLTQSLHSLFAELRGETGQHQGLALLSNFSTKLFHALGSSEDATYASNLIGNAPQMFMSGNSQPNEDLFSGLMGLTQYSGGFSEQMQPIVLPQQFMNELRTGGAANDYKVDAIVVKSGEPFADGRNFKFVCFDQRS